MANLLTNVQDVCMELGLPTPTAVASSTDFQIKQLQALMNRVGDTLSTERDWQVLASEYRFNTVFYTVTGNVTANSKTVTSLSSVAGLTSDFMCSGAGIAQDSLIISVSSNSAVLSVPATATATGVKLTFGRVYYPMPADFERMVDKTQYNKTTNWQVLGPKNAQEWQSLKSSYASTGLQLRFRIIGDKFTIYPMPTSVFTLGFEYISNSWVTDISGSLKSKMTLDTDSSRFPDRLIVLGTKLKLFEIKGFDTTALLQDYARELEKWKASESGADTLSLAPSRFGAFLSSDNLPDTGYGSVTT
jgi:hypothetical protein